jgi:hypothetical protein
MSKSSRRIKKATSKGRKGSKVRRLIVGFSTHKDLVSNLRKAADVVSNKQRSRKITQRKGFAAAVVQKTCIGYDEALKIVLQCSGRTGPEDPVVDPQAPAASKDQIIQCILQNLRSEGFSLSPSPAIGDGETCDALANEVQYASN